MVMRNFLLKLSIKKINTEDVEISFETSSFSKKDIDLIVKYFNL